MRVYYKTDAGRKRTLNEDYLVALDLSKGHKEIGLFIVADGVGGRNAGEIASTSACKKVVKVMKATLFNEPITAKSIRTAPLYIENAIKSANRLVYEYSRESPEYMGMGTTLTMTTILDQYMFVGHVGDCRVYKINESIQQLTKDHSVVQELIDAKKITKEQAKSHPYRYTITRAVGLYPDVTVDVYRDILYRNDKILLCSDGLTNLVDDTEIENIVTSNVDDPCEELVKLANERGGDDNISVILIKFDLLPTIEDTLSAHTVMRFREIKPQQTSFVKMFYGKLGKE